MEGLTLGARAAVGGVVAGGTGLLRDPYRGLSFGALGGLRGVASGVIGIATKPAAGALDGIVLALQGLLNQVNSRTRLARVRIPRFIAADGALPEFSQREAEGAARLQLARAVAEEAAAGAVAVATAALRAQSGGGVGGGVWGTYSSSTGRPAAVALPPPGPSEYVFHASIAGFRRITLSGGTEASGVGSGRGGSSHQLLPPEEAVRQLQDEYLHHTRVEPSRGGRGLRGGDPTLPPTPPSMTMGGGGGGGGGPPLVGGGGPSPFSCTASTIACAAAVTAELPGDFDYDPGLACIPAVRQRLALRPELLRTSEEAAAAGRRGREAAATASALAAEVAARLQRVKSGEAEEQWGEEAGGGTRGGTYGDVSSSTFMSSSLLGGVTDLPSPYVLMITSNAVLCLHSKSNDKAWALPLFALMRAAHPPPPVTAGPAVASAAPAAGAPINSAALYSSSSSAMTTASAAPGTSTRSLIPSTQQLLQQLPPLLGGGRRGATPAAPTAPLTTRLPLLTARTDGPVLVLMQEGSSTGFALLCTAPEDANTLRRAVSSSQWGRKDGGASITLRHLEGATARRRRGEEQALAQRAWEEAAFAARAAYILAAAQATRLARIVGVVVLHAYATLPAELWYEQQPPMEMRVAGSVSSSSSASSLRLWRGGRRGGAGRTEGRGDALHPLPGGGGGGGTATAASAPPSISGGLSPVFLSAVRSAYGTHLATCVEQLRARGAVVPHPTPLPPASLVMQAAPAVAPSPAAAAAAATTSYVTTTTTSTTAASPNTMARRGGGGGGGGGRGGMGSLLSTRSRGAGGPPRLPKAVYALAVVVRRNSASESGAYSWIDDEDDGGGSTASGGVRVFCVFRTVAALERLCGAVPSTWWQQPQQQQLRGGVGGGGGDTPAIGGVTPSDTAAAATLNAGCIPSLYPPPATLSSPAAATQHSLGGRDGKGGTMRGFGSLLSARWRRKAAAGAQVIAPTPPAILASATTPATTITATVATPAPAAQPASTTGGGAPTSAAAATRAGAQQADVATVGGIGGGGSTNTLTRTTASLHAIVRAVQREAAAYSVGGGGTGTGTTASSAPLSGAATFTQVVAPAPSIPLDRLVALYGVMEAVLLGPRGALGAL